MEECGDECEECDDECDDECGNECDEEYAKPAFEMFECMDEEPVSVDACCDIASDMIYVICSMIYLYFFHKMTIEHSKKRYDYQYTR